MVKQDLVMQSQNKLKYIFVGNRKFVLEEMLMLNLDLQVLVVKNTHLEKDQILKKVNHKIIQSKDELIEYINIMNLIFYYQTGVHLSCRLAN